MKKVLLNIEEYFDRSLDEIPGATLVVALDPGKLLKLPGEYIDQAGKEWRVYHYYLNDLSFRLEYAKKTSDPNFAHIVWVTEVELSFIPDILSQSDGIIDLSIDSVLRTLMPKESFPDSIFNFQEEIAKNLSTFHSAYKELRKVVPTSAPLNKNHIQILVLASRNGSLKVDDLVFDESRADNLLYRYLKLIFSNKMEKEDMDIIKNLVVENAKGRAEELEKIKSWLKEDESEIAVFLFILDILSKYEVENPYIQLNGLGILPFDSLPLRELAEGVIKHLRDEKSLFSNIASISEEVLTEGEVNRVVESLNLTDPIELINAIGREKSPVLVFALTKCLLRLLMKDKNSLKDAIRNSEQIIQHEILQGLDQQTKFYESAEIALELVKEIIFIESTLKTPIVKVQDFATILGWYEKNKIYRLQLAHAKARKLIRHFEDKELRDSLIEYLNQLQDKISDYLEEINLDLSSLIEKNIQGFLQHPRLIVNILREFIIRGNFTPTAKRKLWILIFDGMRLDTWNEVVKPLLSNIFEIIGEKLFLSLLPSFTDISRISLLAGKIPSEWRDYRDRATSDHNILASRLFGLQQDEGRQKLRVVVRSESDFAQMRLDFGEHLYNALIYNLSDDWIHAFSGDVFELNETIRGNLERTILPDLRNRIGDNDCVVVTSDHGFIELERDKKVELVADEGQFIAYRYLRNFKHPEGLNIKHTKELEFSVAKGRKWFYRQGGKPARYSHGGISFDEMVVPGVLMKKLTSPFVKIEMVLPQLYGREFIEDEEATFEVIVRNEGNVPTEFNLRIQPDFTGEKVFKQTISGKDEVRCPFTFIPSLKSKNIYFYLSYTDAKKKEQKEQNRIGLIVTPRKGKVEIDTSALDRLS
ncbi:MAG TPA: PglZ domain-containing protein [Thermodesulfobacteriota bacterium]|nr:PglZ domain-containing protein [Thermodesulfobacteriota bacterium]